MAGLSDLNNAGTVNPNMVNEVKQMLMQGANPEELLQRGIPQAVIEQAMMELQAEMQQSQGQGLAGLDSRNVQQAL